jgi:hypothetical protein
VTEHQCQACTAPAPTTTLCWDCLRNLSHHLADLADDLAELHTQLARQSRLGAGVGSRSAETAVAYDVRASEILDDVRTVLVGWTRVACETEGDWPADTEAAMIRRLRRARWATHPTAGELLDELQYTHTEVLRCIDRPQPRRYLGPCATTLEDGTACPGDVQQRGTRMPTCRDCGATHAVDQRLAWIAERAADQLVTASEAAGALSAWGEHITSDLIRKWAQRGRITPRGHDRHGHPVYQFGECRALALDSVTRRIHSAS